MHVGAVKDKVEVKGTIEAIRYIEGNYGTTTLYTILGEDGNLYKWFSSAGSLGDDAGVAVHIKGTVKSHDEYNGTLSTVLTRVPRASQPEPVGASATPWSVQASPSVLVR